MTGEKDLAELLRSMKPALMAGEFVFCSFENAQYGDHADLEPIAAVKERKSLALVIPKAKADERKLEYESVFRGITLNIHSSLNAVGFTAAFSSKLAEYGISANVFAGYYHDHIFIQHEHAEKAIAAINELTR